MWELTDHLTAHEPQIITLYKTHLKIACSRISQLHEVVPYLLQKHDDSHLEAEVYQAATRMALKQKSKSHKLLLPLKDSTSPSVSQAASNIPNFKLQGKLYNCVSFSLVKKMETGTMTFSVTMVEFGLAISEYLLFPTVNHGHI